MDSDIRFFIIILFCSAASELHQLCAYCRAIVWVLNLHMTAISVLCDKPFEPVKSINLLVDHSPKVVTDTITAVCAMDSRFDYVSSTVIGEVLVVISIVMM